MLIKITEREIEIEVVDCGSLMGHLHWIAHAFSC